MVGTERASLRLQEEEAKLLLPEEQTSVCAGVLELAAKQVRERQC